MKMKNHKGIKILKAPITKQVGGWSRMTFDASIKRNGLTWLRVKDGMGGRGDREDWVCDIPSLVISIHDYHWNGDNFGANHGSFNGAILAETKLAIERAKRRISELTQELHEQEVGFLLAQKSLPPPHRERIREDENRNKRTKIGRS